MSTLTWKMTPEQAAEEHGMTVETLRERAQIVYLATNLGRRTASGFNRLWKAWAAGKSDMPVSVEVSLGSLITDEALDYLRKTVQR